MQEAVGQEVARERTGEASVPTTFVDYLKGVGPGIVIAVAWLGTGDLVDSSVAGANYGYALMWAIVLALFCRYFTTSMLAKYQLCNGVGDETVLTGFGRLWRGFPLLLAAASTILGFIYASYLLKAAGTALWNLTGRIGGEGWGIFVWSAIIVAFSIFLALSPNQYRGLEIVAQIAVVAVIVAFFIALINTGINFGGFLSGLTPFKLPPDVGAFSALLVTVSVIGAVGGSAANLIYPYLMRDKGWRGQRYRRLQTYDLIIGVASLVFINLAIWVVAAETLPGRGEAIAEADDLAAMMEQAVGSFGPTLMWIAIFFIAFDNIPAYSYGFTRILVEAVHETFPARGARYAHAARTASHGDSPVVHSSEGDVSKEELAKSETSTKDPIFRYSQIGLLIVLPLIFSLPGLADFILLTIVANAMAVLTAPIILVGVILITNNRQWMLSAYRNKWWENLILLVIAGIGLWATYGVIKSIADLLFGGG
jgi:Mn2+/Fe2+ NRAMP family transporter